MVYRIIHEIDECIGCGSCAAVCSENWIMQGDKSAPRNKKVKKISCNQDAADACPVQCIRIEEVE